MNIRKQLILAAHKEMDFAQAAVIALEYARFAGYKGDEATYERIAHQHRTNAEYLMQQAEAQL